METAHLFHLARIAAREGSIKVAAAHMVFANRSAAPGDDGFISPQLVESTEPLVGQACLDALVAFDIPEAVSLPFHSVDSFLMSVLWPRWSESPSYIRICLGPAAAA